MISESNSCDPVKSGTMGRFALFAGTANPVLAAAIAGALDTELDPCHVERFPDGEISVRLDASVRGREVFIVQPTAPPVNDNLVELLAFADACRRASAERITVVVPYFGYSRSDRRNRRREPIMASLTAELLQCSGIDHVVLVDVHTPQVEGFFRVPVDSLTAVPVLCARIREQLPSEAVSDLVVVSPDAGRVPMATEYARRLGAPLAVLHKRRDGPGDVTVLHLGGDVQGRSCLVADDMISTGSTIVEGVRALRSSGALPDITVVATHGLLLQGARERLAASGVRRMFITDSVADTYTGHSLSQPQQPPEIDIHVASIAPLLASAIRRQLADESLSDLF